MTQYGKCDNCRRRKVKCDEKQPICGPCFRGDRPCAYTYSKRHGFSAFVDYHNSTEKPQRRSMKVQVDPALPSGPIRLEHRSKYVPLVPLATTTTAMTEAGSFYTLAPRGSGRGGRKKKPHCQTASATAQYPTPPSPRLLALDADSLTLRWRRLGEAVLPGEPQPYNLVEWSEEVPQWFGHQPVLDTAFECLISSVVYFIDRKPLNLRKLQDHICKAMSNIRQGMFSDDCEMVQDMILLSINVVASAESFVRMSATNFKLHIRGANHLMDRVTEGGTKWTANGIRMFYCNYATDFHEALLQGRDSLFDTPTWLATPSPKFEGEVYPLAEFVEKQQMQQRVRFPRLIRLVRKAREFPEDLITRAEAINLATDLYLDSLEYWVDQLKNLGYFWEVLSTDASSPLPISYIFSTMRIVRPLVQYWVNRCQICQLVLSLCDIFPVLTSPYEFDPSVVITEQIRAAENVAMTNDYAMAAASPLPTSAMRQQVWLVGTFGAWCRLEETATTPLEVDRALRMQLWILEVSDRIDKTGLGFHNTMERLKTLHALLAGGPLPQPVPSC